MFTPTNISWTAGLLVSETHSYLTDSGALLWVWNHPLKTLSPVSTITTPMLSKLFYGFQKELWGISLQEERVFKLVDSPLQIIMQTHLAQINNLTNATPPFLLHSQIPLCPMGYLLFKSSSSSSVVAVVICLPSPPGGYTIPPGQWFPCPLGTYNSQPLAITSLACIPCPPSTIAPTIASAICSHCNKTHPWQSPDKTACLLSSSSSQQLSSNKVAISLTNIYFSNQPQTQQGTKKQCPATSFFDLQQQLCFPCPFVGMASMPGAHECTWCLQGQYTDPFGNCQPCSPTLFLPSCAPPFMLEQTNMSVMMMTFQEAIRPPYHNNYDIVCAASVVIADQAGPPLSYYYFALPNSDFLGRLWSIVPTLTPSSSNTILNLPGLWVLCSSAPSSSSSTCSYGPLTLSPAWDKARQYWGLQDTLFVIRANTLTTPTPIQVSTPLQERGQEGGSIEMPGTLNGGDTGMCYVGWPAQYNCTDPTFYWSFTASACLPCPSDNMLALSPMDISCIPISKDHPLCPAGTFLQLDQCIACPSGTFSNTKQAANCRPKTVFSCQPHFYVHQMGPFADNECLPCLPCPSNTITVPHNNNDVCASGNLTSPPYACATMQNIRGFYLLLNNVHNDLEYVACPTPPPPHSQWETGPYYDVCYFSCKYGVRRGNNNLFSLLMPNPPPHDDEDVCAPCNTTRCPDGLWRPIYSPDDGCGAPCLLNPSLCKQDRLDGCIDLCPIPPHAHFTDPQQCLWECDHGWFLFPKQSTTNCLPCHPLSCVNPGGELYLPSQCYLPHATYSSVCTPCPSLLPGATFVTDNNSASTCHSSYVCKPGYFHFQFPSGCLPCPSFPANYFCEAGSRPSSLTMSSCDPQQQPCSPCPSVLPPPNSVYLPSNNFSACRILCKPGYHTISVATGRVLPTAQEEEEGGFDTHNIISCQACGLRSSTPCPQRLSCPPHQAPSTNTTTTTTCQPCKTSLEMACPPGTYAPPCHLVVSTNYIPQMNNCLLCPSYFHTDGRFFIPYYSAAADTTCPFACPANTMLINGSCVACALLKNTVPNTNYYSLWNATAGPRWWPPELDPPHLGLTGSQVRAGLCWPCPSPSSALLLLFAYDDLCRAPPPSVLVISSNLYYYTFSD